VSLFKLANKRHRSDCIVHAKRSWADVEFPSFKGELKSGYSKKFLSKLVPALDHNAITSTYIPTPAPWQSEWSAASGTITYQPMNFQNGDTITVKTTFNDEALSFYTEELNKILAKVSAIETQHDADVAELEEEQAALADLGILP